jgi:hypothetical protein
VRRPTALSRLSLPAAASLLAACSGANLETGGLKLPAVAVPDLPKVDLTKVELPKVELPKAVPPVKGAPTEVYTRIAAGTLTCWFGAGGALKAGYIYHADAESPARGGRAEIVVHERDTTPGTKEPRGSRAFTVEISPDGETSKVVVENVRLPPPIAGPLQSDIERWAGGETGCAEHPTEATWATASRKAPPGEAKSNPRAASKARPKQRTAASK